LSCVEIPKPYSKIPPGIWRGTLVLEDAPDSDKEDTVLPFNFEVQYTDNDNVIMIIHNGEERIEVKDITFTQDRKTGRDSIFIDFPLMDTHIAAEHKDHIIQGRWHVHYREDYSVPFLAYSGDNVRFKDVTPANHDLSGEWNVKMEIESEDEYPAIGDFKQKGNTLTGTFETETGDYRYLEGVVSGDDFYLSCFDGSHAFYFDGKVTEEGDLFGRFLSGVHYNVNWIGTKDAEGTLANPYEFSQVNDENVPITFEYKNTEGQIIGPNSSAYKGKPKIVKLMGTWCPNCLDETNFLLEYLEQHPDNDIDIIAIAFERYRDEEKALEMIKNYRERKDIPWEMLYGGYYDKSEATENFGFLEKIKSYPTLLFLDENNRIVETYTGFAGPATRYLLKMAIG